MSSSFVSRRIISLDIYPARRIAVTEFGKKFLAMALRFNHQRSILALGLSLFLSLSLAIAQVSLALLVFMHTVNVVPSSTFRVFICNCKYHDDSVSDCLGFPA